MMGLTPTMADCVRVIQELTDLNEGVPPTYDEIGAEMGLSRGGVAGIVKRLRDRGWVRMDGRMIDLLGRLPMPEEPNFVGRFDPDAAIRPVLVIAEGES